MFFKDGNDGYIFVDGEYVITSQDGSSAVNAADPVTITTFVLMDMVVNILMLVTF